LFFFIISYRVLNKRKKYKKKINHAGRKNQFYWLLIFLVSIVALFISANLAVRFATGLATDLNLPQIIIGLFLLSIATTLPELVFGISAATLKHKSMAIGDQVGTIITNTTLIIGIVAIIEPITAEFFSFITAGLFMLFSAFIFLTFLKTGSKFERIEGISLILIYVLFIIFEFFMK
jgi:cation:H+ antiporter